MYWLLLYFTFLTVIFFAYVLFRRNKHGSQCYVFHQRFDKRSSSSKKQLLQPSRRSDRLSKPWLQRHLEFKNYAEYIVKLHRWIICIKFNMQMLLHTWTIKQLSSLILYYLQVDAQSGKLLLSSFSPITYISLSGYYKAILRSLMFKHNTAIFVPKQVCARPTQ